MSELEKKEYIMNVLSLYDKEVLTKYEVWLAIKDKFLNNN